MARERRVLAKGRDDYESASHSYRYDKKPPEEGGFSLPGRYLAPAAPWVSKARGRASDADPLADDVILLSGRL